MRIAKLQWDELNSCRGHVLRIQKLIFKFFLTLQVYGFSVHQVLLHRRKKIILIFCWSLSFVHEFSWRNKSLLMMGKLVESCPIIGMIWPTGWKWSEYSPPEHFSSICVQCYICKDGRNRILWRKEWQIYGTFGRSWINGLWHKFISYSLRCHHKWLQWRQTWSSTGNRICTSL